MWLFKFEIIGKWGAQIKSFFVLDGSKLFINVSILRDETRDWLRTEPREDLSG